MAEFIDVMKKARTMCAETEDCSPACPVYGLFDCGCPLTELLVRSNDWLQKVEQKIMGWEKPNPEPKPCPFCGGKANVSEKHFGWSVYCANVLCLMNTGTKIFVSRTDAIEAWNRRG